MLQIGIWKFDSFTSPNYKSIESDKFSNLVDSLLRNILDDKMLYRKVESIQMDNFPLWHYIG